MNNNFTILNYLKNCLDNGEHLNLPLLNDDVLVGIGSGGQGYLTGYWRELTFIIKLAVDLKTRNQLERQKILTTYDDFVAWIAKLPEGGTRQFRHMLRYVAFPDRVERIASNNHRQEILDRFGVAPKKTTGNWSDQQLDETLFNLRSILQKEYPGQVLDFYESPLKVRWKPDEEPQNSPAALKENAKSKEPVLAAPFNEFFASFEEANQGFDLIKETLIKFGVNPAEHEKEGRISLTLVGKRNRMRLNFADWAVLTFKPLSKDNNRLEFMCIKNLIPAAAQNTESDFAFSDKVDGQEFSSGTCTVPILHDPKSEENHAYLQSLELAGKRFKNSKGSRWPMNHEPQVLQMVFDTELRQKLLKEGLNPAERTNGKNEIAPKETLPESLNIILYGPPGTGKTYRLRNTYMEMFTDRQAMPTPEERAAALVKEADLSWWEVIALALLDTKDHRATVAQILSHALVAAQVRKSSNNNPRAMIWASLQIHTKDECPNVKYTSRSQPLVFEKDESSVWSIDVALVDKEAPELHEMLNGFNHPEKNGPPVACRYRFTTFHQSFSYEDFIEGIKPQMGDAVGDRQNDQVTYEIKDGVFKAICREAKDNPTKKYALFIDEINRGNGASIFGELITLIEDDKRLGGKNQLTAILPYSRKEFGVPDNLYIIGTMNTADRSVEALDTALRRRFVFEEMRPDRDKVSQYPDGKVDLQKMFDVINARIEQLLDHDHCIGHAYFMGIEDLDGLRSVFANKIQPLLREYFYGNPAKVGMVLGDRFVLRQTNKRPFAPGSWGADELDEKDVFAFADVTTLTEVDFATIYAEVRPGI